MPKDRSIYKVDSNDSRRVIIYLPGIVYASQYVISPHSQGSIGVRNSCIDPEYSVLDVVDPIVSPWREHSDGLIVIDGHHRLAEAARRRIGIEARLVRCTEDLDFVPDVCFHNLSRDYIASTMLQLNYHRGMTLGGGVDLVGDLV
ncbi:MAG: hypothetical protein AABX47_07930 [Nanoarchaeota archaeon]